MRYPGCANRASPSSSRWVMSRHLGLLHRVSGRGHRGPAGDLTGSIGVFGGKLVVDGLLERIGVSTGTVQQGERALMYSSRRGFSEDERARFAATIDAIYERFRGQGGGRTRACCGGDRSRRSGPGVDRPGCDSRPAWWTSLAACGMPFASPASAPACPMMHLCSARSAYPPLGAAEPAEKQRRPAYLDGHDDFARYGLGSRQGSRRRRRCVGAAS